MANSLFSKNGMPSTILNHINDFEDEIEKANLECMVPLKVGQSEHFVALAHRRHLDFTEQLTEQACSSSSGTRSPAVGFAGCI